MSYGKPVGSETENFWPTINNMSRHQIQQILEDHGFAVYDSEDFEELKQTLAANVDDGTINPICLETYSTWR